MRAAAAVFMLVGRFGQRDGSASRAPMALAAKQKANHDPYEWTVATRPAPNTPPKEVSGSVSRGGDSKKRPTYCADDSMRRDSDASSMWRPGCQLFLAFVRSHRTHTRRSRACISLSHGPTTTPTSPTSVSS